MEETHIRSFHSLDFAETDSAESGIDSGVASRAALRENARPESRPAPPRARGRLVRYARTGETNKDKLVLKKNAARARS